MHISLAVEWTVAAQFTWLRLPSEVQAGLSRLLRERITCYAQQYRERVDQQMVISASPLIYLPEWTIWVRLQLHYQEDEEGAIVFVYECEELTRRESEQALNRKLT